MPNRPDIRSAKVIGSDTALVISSAVVMPEKVKKILPCWPVNVHNPGVSSKPVARIVPAPERLIWVALRKSKVKLDKSKL